MPQKDFNDLAAFAAVATERSFTRAAVKLGVSQSVLSQTIRNLEQRLELRLLTRTTRSVSPTEVGERLLQTVRPRFEDIETELATLNETRDKPAGTIRINAGYSTTITLAGPRQLFWPVAQVIYIAITNMPRQEANGDHRATDQGLHGTKKTREETGYSRGEGRSFRTHSAPD